MNWVMHSMAARPTGQAVPRGALFCVLVRDSTRIVRVPRGLGQCPGWLAFPAAQSTCGPPLRSSHLCSLVQGPLLQEVCQTKPGALLLASIFLCCSWCYCNLIITRLNIYLS